MKASVVIGANYGDEGKGLVTDYLANKQDSSVVRFNGGAQAGHTVVTPNGKRHVFKHLGAGALAGAETFLSRFFAVCPMVFGKEHDGVHRLGGNATVWVDPMAPVTTPYDIMLNQAAEKDRGDKRHGSCGMGFNETLTRHNDMAFRMTVGDLTASRQVRKNHLEHMRHRYVPERCAALGMKVSLHRLDDDRILERFLDDQELFCDLTKIMNWNGYVAQLKDKHVIFEGAQGLLLDMDHENFPHVTRSKTNLANVTSLATDAYMLHLDVYYVTRTYLTKHGAGPLAHELTEPPKGGLCMTNTHNEHQGPLRYAALDPLSFLARVKEDALAPRPFTVAPHIVFTCADQTSGHLETPAGSLPLEPFAKDVAKMLGGKHALVSYGPTRNDIKEIHL